MLDGVADRVSFEFPFRNFGFKPALLIDPFFRLRRPFPIITDFCIANQFILATHPQANMTHCLPGNKIQKTLCQEISAPPITLG